MKRRTLLQSLPAQHFPCRSLASSELEKPGPGPTSTVLRTPRLSHLRRASWTTCCGVSRAHHAALRKHGIKNIAYWTPTDEPLKSKTLIYIIAHPSREAAAANWQAFRDDPEWQSVRDKSEANGKLVEKSIPRISF